MIDRKKNFFVSFRNPMSLGKRKNFRHNFQMRHGWRFRVQYTGWWTTLKNEVPLATDTERVAFMSYNGEVPKSSWLKFFMLTFSPLDSSFSENCSTQLHRLTVRKFWAKIQIGRFSRSLPKVNVTPPTFKSAPIDREELLTLFVRITPMSIMESSARAASLFGKTWNPWPMIEINEIAQNSVHSP